MLTSAQLTRRRVFGGLSLLLGVALIAVAVLGFTGRLGASSPATRTDDQAAPTAGASGSRAPTSTAVTSAKPSVDPSVKAPVTVVNASSTAGLAARVRDQLTKGGWEVPEVANYTGTPPGVTTVYYPAGDTNAAAAAQNLKTQFPKLTTVSEAPAGFPFSGLVVVLTGDWDPAAG